MTTNGTTVREAMLVPAVTEVEDWWAAVDRDMADDPEGRVVNDPGGDEDAEDAPADSLDMLLSLTFRPCLNRQGSPAYGGDFNRSMDRFQVRRTSFEADNQRLMELLREEDVFQPANPEAALWRTRFTSHVAKVCAFMGARHRRMDRPESAREKLALAQEADARQWEVFRAEGDPPPAPGLADEEAEEDEDWM